MKLFHGEDSLQLPTAVERFVERFVRGFDSAPKSLVINCVSASYGRRLSNDWSAVCVCVCVWPSSSWILTGASDRLSGQNWRFNSIAGSSTICHCPPACQPVGPTVCLMGVVSLPQLHSVSFVRSFAVSFRLCSRDTNSKAAACCRSHLSWCGCGDGQDDVTARFSASNYKPSRPWHSAVAGRDERPGCLPPLETWTDPTSCRTSWTIALCNSRRRIGSCLGLSLYPDDIDWWCWG